VTKLILVRHGATEWNQLGLIQGLSDVPLSATGLYQMERVAAHLDAVLPTSIVIVSSDLKRCARSADLIGVRRQLEPSLYVALREVDFGGWTGHKIDELRAQPVEQKAWDEMTPDFVWKGGESFADAHNRADHCLRAVVDQHPGQCIVVFTHGAIIQLVLSQWLCGSLHAARRFGVSNASITILESPTSDRVRLRVLNKRLDVTDGEDDDTRENVSDLSQCL